MGNQERGPKGVDPSDFGEENSADLDSILKSGEVFIEGLNAGFTIDELIDTAYHSGIDSDYTDTVLSELDHRNGAWN